MKNVKKIFLLLLVICIQTSLIRSTFHHFFAHPNEFVHSDQFDGLKNLFTMHSFIHDTANADVTKYRFMNYPFGEYVTYTDNTPLFSVLFKVFAKNDSGALNNDVAAFNFILIFNLLIASVLLFFILLRFIDSSVLLVLFSVCLVWINPMFIRLGGDPNLSLSSVVLANILLLIHFVEADKSRIKRWLFGILMVVLLCFSFFIHVYFLFILSFTIAFFLFFNWVIAKKVSSFIAAFAIPVCGFVLCLISMQYLDKWLALRSNEVMGYGFDNWELSTAAMFTPYGHLSFAQLFPHFNYPYDYEATCYMGYFFSAALLLLLIAYVYNKHINSESKLFPPHAAKLCWLFFLTSFFLMMVAYGEKGYIFGMRHKYYGLLNPVFYLHPFVPSLSHIRYVVRFMFPVFFMLNIITLTALVYQLRSWNVLAKWTALTILLSLLIIETKDEIKGVHPARNPLSENYIAEHIKLPVLPYDSFQAILPVPYYHVGVARAACVIETDEDFFNRTLSISSHTHLPLMSSKMSRTLASQNQAFLEMFIHASLPDSILHLMNQKPVLIIKDKWTSAMSSAAKKPREEPGVSVFKAGDDFAERVKAELLYTDERYSYYKWTITQ